MFLLLGRFPLPKIIMFIGLAGLVGTMFGPARVQAANQASDRYGWIRYQRTRYQRASSLRPDLKREAMSVKPLNAIDNRSAVAALQVTTTVTTTTTATASATATGSVTPSPTITGTAAPTTTSTTPQPTDSPTATETPNPGTPTPTTSLTEVATSTPSPTITATAATTQPQVPITTPIPAPGILAFDAKPSAINAGASTVLSWRLVNAEIALLRANHDEETLSTTGDKMEGSKTITPTENTVYTLIARSRGGEAATQVTITVNSLVLTPTLAAAGPITVPAILAQTQPVTTPNAAPLIQIVTPSPTPTLQVVIPDSPLLTATTTLTPLRSVLTLPLTPVDLNPQSPPPDPVQTQQLMLFGVLAAALMVPFGIASLALLIWVIGRQL